MAADESSAPRAPRHGRHAAARRHAAPQVDTPEIEVTPEVEAVPEASVSAEQVAEPTVPPVKPVEVVPDLVPILDGDQETQLGDAPRPIDVDPSETGSFERIGAADGARVTTRANASQTASFRLENARPMEAVRMSSSGRPHVERHETEVKSNKRVFAILAISALLVVGTIGWLLSRALGSVDRNDEPTVVEQTQGTVETGIQYRGTTYMVEKLDSGVYALTSTSEGSEGKAVVCELKGTPVTLVLYNTVFIIPENLPDGTWDLIAHPLGGGSVTQQVTDANGAPIVRNGVIEEARLDGPKIVIKTNDGGSFTVSLEAE